MSSTPRGLTDDEVAQACKEPDAVTQPYFFQQTMYRVKDPKKSLEFYTNVLGMRLVNKFDFPSMQFTVYFMAYSPKDEVPTDEKERIQYCFNQKATLELTHNYGTENDEEFAYHNGNKEPKGYGHIGICVPDVYDACKRFEEMGVNFIKKPDDGKMKGLAFITDPDGYWIEIISPKNILSTVGK